MTAGGYWVYKDKEVEVEVEAGYCYVDGAGGG